MSGTNNYSFKFCKIILNYQNNRKTLSTKRGDIIAVPEFIDEPSLPTINNRKKTATPIQQNDKFSTSTISDFGNSFNSDIKSFLSTINK